MNVIEKSSSNQVTLDLESKLIDDRIIFIKGEINLEMSAEIQSCLLYLKSKSNDPISIYINSPGGSVYSGLAIYDTIKHLQKQGIVINTYACGLVASMAAILFLSGTHKYSLPNSTFMFHSVSSYTCGKVLDMIIDAEETKRLQNIIKDILDNCNKQISKNCEYLDFYVDVNKAKELNIVNEII